MVDGCWTHRWSSCVGRQDGQARSTASSASRTVGDLLRHYPRRYARARRADRPRGPAGRRARRRSSPRVATVDVATGCRTARGTLPRGRRHRRHRPSCCSRSSASSGAARTARKLRGRTGLFAGKVGALQGQPAARPPRLRAARRRVDAVDAAGLRRASSSRSTPRPTSSRPGRSTQTVEVVLDACSTTLPDPLPDDVRARHGAGRSRRGAAADPPAADRRRLDSARRDRLRFDEAFVLQVVLARRRAEMAALAATSRVARDGRSARGVRRAAAVRADRRPAARSAAQIAGRPGPRPSDAPAAAGRGRLRQDRRRAAGDARGRRQRGPGRAARPDRGARRSSTTARITAMLGPLARARPARRRRPTAPGSRCSPARSRPRRAAAALLDVASGDAGIVVGTHALLEEQRRVRRPRPGRRRRAAPVRRRAARRAARKAERSRRTCWS